MRDTLGRRDSRSSDGGLDTGGREREFSRALTVLMVAKEVDENEKQSGSEEEPR
jgi:hypothetical protein